MGIVEVWFDDLHLRYIALRSDGVRLRLKRVPPSYIIEGGKKRYAPIEAINAWLGFT